VTDAARESIFEVRAEAADGKVSGFGARASRTEGAALLAERVKVYRGASGWVRWWLEQIDTTGLWKAPTPPGPRDRYSTRVTEVSAPGT
jgi:hypothetical protein